MERLRNRKHNCAWVSLGSENGRFEYPTSLNTLLETGRLFITTAQIVVKVASYVHVDVWLGRSLIGLELILGSDNLSD